MNHTRHGWPSQPASNTMATIDDLKIDAPAPEHAKRRWLQPSLAMLVIFALIVCAGWRFRDYLGPRATPVEVYTIPSESAALGGGFTAGGYLEVIPPGPLVVSAMVEGRVRSVEIIEGQPAMAGQVLARLDDVLYRQEVRVRQAAVALDRAKLARQEAGFRVEEIAQAKADLERAEARLLLAQTQHTRNEHLLRSAALSKQEHDASLSELTAARADVATRLAEINLRKAGYRKEDIAIARAEVEAAEAELDRAQWKVDACVIKAPFSGVVLERFVQPGDWLSLTVSPSSQRERPNAIVSLVDPKRVQAWADVNHRDSGRVFVGQDALLATDAAPGRPIRGRVVRILPKANLQKNTVRVNVEIPDPPADFRPEMSVKVTFASGDGGLKASPGVVVPASAVLRNGSKAVAYLHVRGRVQARVVEPTEEVSGRVTVLSGLAPGDQVIVAPQGLADGQGVEVKN